MIKYNIFLKSSQTNYDVYNRIVKASFAQLEYKYFSN